MVRDSRRLRLFFLCSVLEGGPKYNMDLRKLPVYRSEYQVEGDCILLFKAGVVELSGGLKDRRQEKVALKERVTPERLEELFPSAPKGSNGEIFQFGNEINGWENHNYGFDFG